MVKVTDLMGAVPEGNDAKTTTLRTLQLFRKISKPIIYAGLCDARSALRVNMVSDLRRLFAPHNFLAKTHQVLLDQERRRICQYQQAIWKASTVLLQLPRLSPEALEWIEVREAVEQSDEDPFWQFVERRLGRLPDDLLREVLNQYYLPHAGRIPASMILDLLDHHCRRLDHDKPEEWYAWLAEQVYQRLRKNPNHRLMRSLEGFPVAPDKWLKMELPKAVVVAERGGFYGGYFGNPYDWHNRFMLGGVEQQIVGANRLLSDARKRQEHDDHKRDMVVSIEMLGEQDRKQFLATCDLEEEFARLEDERREQRRDMLSKGLPPKERELIHFLRHVYDPEKHGDSPQLAAAYHLGKAPSTVRVQLRRIRQYLAS